MDDIEIFIAIKIHYEHRQQSINFGVVVQANGSASELASNLKQSIQRKVRKRLAAGGIELEMFHLCFWFGQDWVSLNDGMCSSMPCMA